MTSPPASTKIERLARIRLLLDRAVEESRQPPPFAADSINRLHDVAEMFLALACEEHNVPIPYRFDDYWSTLGSVLNRALAYRVPMARFNKVRVNLKHHGIEPSIREIEDARTTVRALLEDECPAIFSVNLCRRQPFRSRERRGCQEVHR